MLDSNSISTSGKGKVPVSSNGIKAYNKETLEKEIRRLIATNVQLINNKLNVENVKTKLEADKINN